MRSDGRLVPSTHLHREILFDRFPNLRRDFTRVRIVINVRVIVPDFSQIDNLHCAILVTSRRRRRAASDASMDAPPRMPPRAKAARTHHWVGRPSGNQSEGLPSKIPPAM